LRHYRRGVRLDTHMHREAQLVYAARGTMQVTTPKGRRLVLPDRAVWVPARLACGEPDGGHDIFLAGHDVFCATHALDCDRLRHKSM
jgi:hypothetical protein